MRRLLPIILCFILLLSGCSDGNIKADSLDLEGDLDRLLNPEKYDTHDGILIQGIIDHSKPKFDIAFNEIPDKVSIDLCAIGDIMAHDGNFAAAKRENGYDFDFMVAEIAKYTIDADYMVANLETCFAGADRKYTGYPLFNTPEQLGESLHRVLGLDLVSNANNHVLDRGFLGIEKTLDNLDMMGIAHTGAYRTEEESEEIFIADIKGAKVAFLSYTYGTNTPVPSNKSFSVNIISKNRLKEAANKAKNSGADYVIALLHWGTEYKRSASQEQQSLSEWIFENTEINLIIGNHPHVVEPIEKFEVERNGEKKTGWVLYALGNFTSAQRYEYSNTGIIAHVNISVDLRHNEDSAVESITYTPIYVDSNPLSTGRRYRVISLGDGIRAYEDCTDPLLNKQEYNEMVKYTEYYRKLLCTDDIISEVE